MIRVEEYFRILLTTNQKEIDYANTFRNYLNGCRTEYQQLLLIQQHRGIRGPGESYKSMAPGYVANRQLDEKLFGIEVEREVEILETEEEIKALEEKENKFFSIENERKLEEKQEDIKNDIIAGTVRGLIFLFKKMSGKIAIGLFIFSLIIGSVYIGGMMSATGSTPFVLCTQDLKAVNNGVKASSITIDQAASASGSMSALVAEMASRGYTPSAMVGIVSYMLQEGAGLGTFTYESYFVNPGPSGEISDKTLDNKAWLEWLNSSSAKANAIRSNPGTYNEGHYAIGLGWAQMSDVWDGGSKSVSNATNMINEAESKGLFWQDPTFQTSFICDNIESRSYDSDWVDPKIYNGSGEEYCARITAFLGMPGYTYTNSSSYMQEHVKHVPAAEEVVKAGGVKLNSFGSTAAVGCETLGSTFANGTGSIAQAAIMALNHDWYRKMFDGVGATGPYANCIGYVSAILRYTVDDSFPRWDPANYIERGYFKNSDWQEITGFKENPDVLQPGDVFMCEYGPDGTSHTFIYVGNKLMKAQYPDSNDDMIESAYGLYEPKATTVAGLFSYDKRTYHVYRYVGQPKTQYLNKDF